MVDRNVFRVGFSVILTVACATWWVSLFKRDGSIVDSMWPLFFVVAAVGYVVILLQPGSRTLWVLALVGIWALRLSGHLTCISEEAGDHPSVEAIIAALDKVGRKPSAAERW